MNTTTISFSPTLSSLVSTHTIQLPNVLAYFDPDFYSPGNPNLLTSAKRGCSGVVEFDTGACVSWRRQSHDLSLVVSVTMGMFGLSYSGSRFQVDDFINDFYLSRYYNIYSLTL